MPSFLDGGHQALACAPSKGRQHFRCKRRGAHSMLRYYCRLLRGFLPLSRPPFDMGGTEYVSLACAVRGCHIGGERPVLAHLEDRSAIHQAIWLQGSQLDGCVCSIDESKLT